MEETAKIRKKLWAWVPSLYFAEGLPNIVVSYVAIVMYDNLGISKTANTFFVGLLYLPWVIKPLWSPVVEFNKTKRFWIITTQFIIGVAFVGLAQTIQTNNFLVYTLAIFWFIAFCSATHDIAADGFYMLDLSTKEQAFFVGIRNFFYKIATIIGKGPLISLVGYLYISQTDYSLTWSNIFYLLSILFLLISAYHYFILPRSINDIPNILISKKTFFNEYLFSFKEFFVQKNIGIYIVFILAYRLGEAQLGAIAPLFLLDDISKGGLGVSNTDLGLIYGTYGTIALIVGSILGGILISRDGLKHWLWWMLIAINLPDILYVYLAYEQPSSILNISICVIIEQFGYGLGFVAFVMCLILISDGKHKTVHYAIATGFMALGMMLPQQASGWLQELMGYKTFFIWVLISTIPGFVVAKFINIDPLFGKK